MSSDKTKAAIESLLVHVQEDRRSFLRHLLTATGAVIAMPLTTSTASARWPEEECYYWERKFKKGKRPAELEVKKKKCPPDDIWNKAKKGKDFWKKGKGKGGWYWPPD